MHTEPRLCYKAIKGLKLKGLGKVFSERAFVRCSFLSIQSREDEPVGHGSAISASISSHAERFYLDSKPPRYKPNPPL